MEVIEIEVTRAMGFTKKQAEYLTLLATKKDLQLELSRATRNIVTTQYKIMWGMLAGLTTLIAVLHSLLHMLGV